MLIFAQSSMFQQQNNPLIIGVIILNPKRLSEQNYFHSENYFKEFSIVISIIFIK